MTQLAWLNELFGLPESASDHAELVDQFLELVHWFMAILFVGWTVYFFYAIIKFRQKKNPKADYYGVRGHGTTHIEIGVIIVEAILLLGFAFPLWGQRTEEFRCGGFKTALETLSALSQAAARQCLSVQGVFASE